MSAKSTSPSPQYFSHRGHRLSYEVHGEGDHVLVYLHGLLLDANLNRPIAKALAERGNRVILLDLLGHGLSDKPAHASQYRMDLYVDEVVALLDHLGIEEAVIGGVSLGADVSLLTATAHPRRVRGLVLEMPVLEHAAPVVALTFVPFMLTVHYAKLSASAVTGFLRRLPRTSFGPLDSVLNAGSLHPDEIAAVLHGIIVGPIGPTYEQRRAMTAPTLVIGHGRDLIHPFSDAALLARQLPNGHLMRASSVLEMRVRPGRLTGEIADFLDEAWASRIPDDLRARRAR